MLRRTLIKSISITPILGLLKPNGAHGCGSGTDGSVLPNSSLQEPIRQVSFQLFSSRFRGEHSYPGYAYVHNYVLSENVEISVPRKPEGGDLIGVQIKIDIDNIRADRKDNSCFCKRIFVYGESEGKTVEQKLHAPINDSDGGVIWTHHISSFLLSRESIPVVSLRTRHVGVLMSVCVAAEIVYTDKGKEGSFYLFNSSQKMIRPPCYFGFLSSNL